MKITILTIFSLITLNSFSQELQDDWYVADVYYSNYSTGVHKDYTLDVRVENNEVVEISFGGRESVHDGYNSDGYYYSTEELEFDIDYNGKINSAVSTVEVRSGGTTKYFEITIEP